jgi:hypothetical protein
LSPEGRGEGQNQPNKSHRQPSHRQEFRYRTPTRWTIPHQTKGTSIAQSLRQFVPVNITETRQLQRSETGADLHDPGNNINKPPPLAAIRDSLTC